MGRTPAPFWLQPSNPHPGWQSQLRVSRGEMQGMTQGISWSTLRAAALFLGCSSHTPHRIRTLLAQTSAGDFGQDCSSGRWGRSQADFWLSDCSHMRVNGSSCGGTKATNSASAWEGPGEKRSSHTQLRAVSCELWAGQAETQTSQVMPMWAEPFLVHRYHQKVFKELMSFYHRAEVAWDPLCGW